MSFMRDKQARRYFLGLFLLCALAVGFCCLFCLTQTQTVKSLLLRQNEAAAGVLLEQGVPPRVIAAAFSGTAASVQGRELLGKIGLTENTPTRFFPALPGFEAGLLYPALLTALLWAGALLLLTLFFLAKREHVYRRAVDTVQQFAKGDFSGHLPLRGEGGLAQLFAAVDGLASTLQSKNETERQTKEFLKQTISDISHQLKTPLAALQMYQEIIAEEAGKPDIVTEFSQR